MNVAVSSSVGRRGRAYWGAYAASNPAEFFAVASEVFFEQSQQLADEHPALFAQLRDFYTVDPLSW